MSLRILIFEDEPFAAKETAGLLKQYDSKIEIVDIIDTVFGGIGWLENSKDIDLILMDIQLADGECFEIFDYIKINIPIIFTTAFDEYALKAFKVNSIDYLLKPLDFDELKLALDKFKLLNTDNKDASINKINKKISDLSDSELNKYRQRFLIHYADKYQIVKVKDILYFYIEENAVFLVDISGNNYSLDYTLDKVNRLLDPDNFYRINRKYIISINAIDKMISFSQYRIKLTLKNCSDNEIVVSRKRFSGFKDWIDQ